MSDVPNDTLNPAADPSPASDQGPQPLTIADDALIPLKVGGKDVTIPWAEARQGFQFHRDYTQKAQSLAEERRQFEAERATLLNERTTMSGELAKLKEVMTNPQALQALTVALWAKQNQPQQPQALTTESLPQLQQTMDQRLQQAIEQFKSEFTQQQQVSDQLKQFGDHTRSLLSRHPALAAVDDIDQVIAKQVGKMNPSGLEEAKSMAQTVIEALAQKQAQALAERDKANLLAKQQAQNGLEPSRGSAPLPKPQSFANRGEREAAIASFMETALAGQFS
jgi:hypothetical protein